MAPVRVNSTLNYCQRREHKATVMTPEGMFDPYSKSVVLLLQYDERKGGP